jgi:hypothetical protein
MNISSKSRLACLCGLVSLVGVLAGCESSISSEARTGGVSARMAGEIDESAAALAPVVETPLDDSALNETEQASLKGLGPGIIYTYKYDRFTGKLKIFVFGQNVVKPRYVVRHSLGEPKVITKVFLNWVPSNIIPNSNAFSAIIPFSGQDHVYFDPLFTGLSDNYYTGTSELNATFAPAGPFIWRNRDAMAFDPGVPTIYGELRTFTEYNTDDACYISYWAGSKWIAIPRKKNNDPDGTISTRWSVYGPDRFRVMCPFQGGGHFVYMDKKFEAAWGVIRVATDHNGYNILEVVHR